MPPWESADTIKPAIQHWNKMYNKWLSTKRTEDHALCWALEMLGVPDLIIDIFQSFHEGMQARVRMD